MLQIDECAAAILAGGQSRRMGTSKALLPLKQGTVLEQIRQELNDFSEVWLSANDEKIIKTFPGRTVCDRYPGSGPIAGIHAVLCQSSRDYVFFVPCDMADFSVRLARAMLEAFPRTADVMVCQDVLGRFYPTCGIYSRRILPTIEAKLIKGNYRMTALLSEMNCVCFQAEPFFQAGIPANLNIREDYLAFLSREDGALSVVCAEEYEPESPIKARTADASG